MLTPLLDWLDFAGVAVFALTGALAAARAAFVALSSGQSVVPPRAHIATADGVTLVMPGYDPRAAVSVWRKMIAGGGGHLPRWLRGCWWPQSCFWVIRSMSGSRC